MKTYNFGAHWTPTDEILEGAISSFEVTPEEVIAIEEGAMIEEEGGDIVITDYTLE